jgi:hypothetical protein
MAVTRRQNLYVYLASKKPIGVGKADVQQCKQARAL